MAPVFSSWTAAVDNAKHKGPVMEILIKRGYDGTKKSQQGRLCAAPLVVYAKLSSFSTLVQMFL